MNIIKRILNLIRGGFTDEGCWVKYQNFIKIGSGAIIAPSATMKIFNPDKQKGICLEIGKGSHIFANFNILRPQAKIIVGKNCQIGNVNFAAAKKIEVGSDVIMSWDVTILDSDNHSLYWEERKYDVARCRKDYLATEGFDLARSHDWEKVKIEPVKICDKVFIGFNVIVLKGVTIGEGSVIGAGSVVTKDILPWHIAAGNPCKHIRKISKKR